ncbi:MAG: sugar phosphate nucleotidyltransferase [Acidimicrobiia bacterium]
MKVVLFCGGLGTRLRDYSDAVPKPMVKIGHRPVLWHVMRYYAHYGHTEFVLCLGYKADVIKEYFLDYSEAASNDFVLSGGGKDLRLLSSDIDDWSITFVDTGVSSNIGERLLAVKDYVDDEPFLANYADGVTDLHLPTMLDEMRLQSDLTAAFMAVPPPLSLHVTDFDEGGRVSSIVPMSASGLYVNAGFFYLTPEVFDFMVPGEELVVEPFQRMSEKSRLVAYPYHGFFRAMDTFKDKQALDDLYDAGPAPWEVWKHERPFGD